MKAEEIDRRVRDADRFSAREMEWLELGPATAALAEAILAEPAEPAAAETAPPPWPTPPRRRRGLLGAAGLAAAALAAAIVLLVGGASPESPSRAYGAQLVRFAESTPLLLLEGPGWRVEDVVQNGPGEGTMEFVTGRPIPDESLTVEGNVEVGQRVSGMLPAAVRQRRVMLDWHRGSLERWVSFAREAPHPHGQRWTEAPVLGTTAQVDTRAEVYVNQGGPGDRQMTAFWAEGGYVLEMRAFVPDLAALEERLGWLERVDAQRWLDAMPAKVVKAADREAAVREMLAGIPVPRGFAAEQVPDEGLTTSRYQVGAAVTGTVSCLWFRQWGEARRAGDRRAEAEAERAMATARRWPILREMARDGGYPAMIWRLAREMPSGVWRRGPEHTRRLLPQAEGLGCARQGIPVLPWKQKRQDERASPGGAGRHEGAAN